MRKRRFSPDEDTNSQSSDDSSEERRRKLRQEKDFYHKVLSYVNGPQYAFTTRLNPANLFVFRSHNCVHQCSCW